MTGRKTVAGIEMLTMMKNLGGTKSELEICSWVVCEELAIGKVWGRERSGSAFFAPPREISRTAMWSVRVDLGTARRVCPGTNQLFGRVELAFYVAPSLTSCSEVLSMSRRRICGEAMSSD